MRIIIRSMYFGLMCGKGRKKFDRNFVTFGSITQPIWNHGKHHHKKHPRRGVRTTKERAKRNRRSINNEVIHLIESQFRANQINVEEVLYKARKLRSKMKGSLTEEEIRQAINRDRDDSI